MSNPAVGNVYATIIDEVINSSRVDFEESGVEESVLEELRRVRWRGFVLLVLSACPPFPLMAYRLRSSVSNSKLASLTSPPSR